MTPTDLATLARWYCDDAAHSHMSATGTPICDKGRRYAETVRRMTDDLNLEIVPNPPAVPVTTTTHHG